MASPMASEAAPMAAMIEVVLTPSCCSTAIPPRMKMALRASDETKNARVGSGVRSRRWCRRSSPSRVSRPAQVAPQMVTTRIKAAAARFTRKSPPVSISLLQTALSPEKAPRRSLAAWDTNGSPSGPRTVKMFTGTSRGRSPGRPSPLASNDGAAEAFRAGSAQLARQAAVLQRLGLEREDHVRLGRVGLGGDVRGRRRVQQMADQVQPSGLLVVVPDADPGRDRRVGAHQHLVARLGVLLPLLLGHGVQRAHLELLERVLAPGLQ